MRALLALLACCYQGMFVVVVFIGFGFAVAILWFSCDIVGGATQHTYCRYFCCVKFGGSHSTIIMKLSDVSYDCNCFVRAFAHAHRSL